GNPVTSTPVHYTTAVTDAGIVKDTLACTTNTNGECTSTVKTTKAGTYNVWVALVPAGAAQPVSPVETALVFLAGDPVPTATTITTSPPTPRAYTGSKITITVASHDARGNVVPAWLLKKELRVTTGAAGIDIEPPVAKGNDAASVDAVLTNAGLADIRPITAAVATVQVGAVSKGIPTVYAPYVTFCLAPHKGADPEPDTGWIATVGVATWNPCLYDIDQTGRYKFVRKLSEDETAILHSTVKLNGVKPIATWHDDPFQFSAEGNVVSVSIASAANLGNMRQTIWVSSRHTIDGKALYLADGSIFRSAGTDAPLPTLPTGVGFFVGYASWSSADRSASNMLASAREVCNQLTAGGPGGVISGVPFTDFPGADVLQGAVSSNPEAFATARVNTYGGGHDVLIYNNVPGDRGDGYYPVPNPKDALPAPVYGIWNKAKVTKETVNGTLTQNVQGAYCVGY
ncbi:hypothetical protein NOO09_004770, partial [Salmonella enterica]|nr:hypothetical protein [Salmonella enterica]